MTAAASGAFASPNMGALAMRGLIICGNMLCGILVIENLEFFDFMLVFRQDLVGVSSVVLFPSRDVSTNGWVYTALYGNGVCIKALEIHSLVIIVSTQTCVYYFI